MLQAAFWSKFFHFMLDLWIVIVYNNNVFCGYNPAIRYGVPSLKALYIEKIKGRF